MQHSGSVDMNPDIFKIALFLTRTDATKYALIKKISAFTGFVWTEGRYNKNMRFKNTRIHLDGASEGCQGQGLSFFFSLFFFLEKKNAVLG